MDERRRLIHRTPNTSPTPESERNYNYSQFPPSAENGVAASGCKVGHVTICLAVGLERMAFYGLTGNLVLFFNEKPFGWHSYNATTMTLMFVGISYLTSIFGGLIADTFLGRFKSLILSLVIYCFGYAFMPVLAYKSLHTKSKDLLPAICNVNSTADVCEKDTVSCSLFQENCSGPVFIFLFIIAVGAGMFRANIAPFGGDQETKSRGEGHHTTFFNWYYWSVNLGTLLSLSIFTYMEQQKTFFSGYLATSICLALSFIVFILGSCSYIYKPRTGSVLKNIFRVLFEACSSRKRQARLKQKHRSGTEDSSSPLDTQDQDSSPQCCIDYAKFRYGGSFNNSQVEDVKQLGKIICVFVTFMLYWMVYFQMQTTFLIQGLHMRLTFTDHSNSSVTNHTSQHKKDNPQIVAAWLSLIDVIFVIILIPIVERFIYPRFERSGRPLSMIRRITFGMIMATLSMFVAGVVEHFRLLVLYPDKDFTNNSCTPTVINQTIGLTNYNAADMSVLYQIPQYALIGISEVFAIVAGIDFAYQMAPRSMKGIIMGLFYMFTGIGSFVGGSSLLAFKDVFFSNEDSGNINCRICDATGKVKLQCHLDYYFYFLGGIGFLGLVLFLLVAKYFNLKELLDATKHGFKSSSVIPGVVDNPPPYSSMPNSPNSTYGRQSEIPVAVSIQGQQNAGNVFQEYNTYTAP